MITVENIHEFMMSDEFKKLAKDCILRYLKDEFDEAFEQFIINKATEQEAKEIPEIVSVDMNDGQVKNVTFADGTNIHYDYPNN